MRIQSFWLVTLRFSFGVWFRNGDIDIYYLRKEEVKFVPKWINMVMVEMVFLGSWRPVEISTWSTLASTWWERHKDHLYFVIRIWGKNGSQIVSVGLPKMPIHIEEPAKNVVFKSITLKTVQGRHIWSTWEDCVGLIADGKVGWTQNEGCSMSIMFCFCNSNSVSQNVVICNAASGIKTFYRTQCRFILEEMPPSKKEQTS